MLEYFLSRDRQYHEQLKKEFDGWENFNDTIYTFKLLTAVEMLKAERGQLVNVLITSQDVDKPGFTKTIVTVPDFEKQSAVLLTLTHELPFGWEAIRDDYELGFTGFLGCLHIDPGGK